MLLGDYLLTSYLLLWDLSGGCGGEGANTQGVVPLLGLLSQPWVVWTWKGGRWAALWLTVPILLHIRDADEDTVYFQKNMKVKTPPNITMLLAFLVITSASWIRVWGWSLHLKCSSVNINFAERENLLMIDSCLWPLARLCCVSLRINRKTLTPGTWYPLCLWIFIYLLVLILLPSELIFHFIFWSLLN